MSRLKKALLTMVAVLILAPPVAAQAHYLTYDSVSSGEQIRYRTNSVSDNAIRRGELGWDRVNSYYNGRGFAVNRTTNDVTVVIRDYRARDGRAAFWNPGCSPDCIWLNRYYMDSYSTYDRGGVVAHELGHGGGFDHPPKTDYFRRNAIMYPGEARTNQPMYHDYRDFYKKWVNR